MDPAPVALLTTLAGALGLLLGAVGATALGRRRREGHAAQLVDADVAVVPLLAALPEVVVVLDGDNHVLRASPAATTLGIIRDRALTEPRVTALVHTVRATGRPREKDLTVARGPVQDAGVFFLHVRVAPTAAGQVLVLIQDVTATRRLEAMRSDFAANVSHELKTPVGALALLAETVASHPDDPGLVADFAGRMLKESRRLTRLVQEIIELSRLQDGDALADPQDVDLGAVLTEALDAVREEAASRGITLEEGGAPGAVVRGDAGQLATALRNLLDNAVRYSEPGTRVRVSTAHGEGLVRVAVADEGIGISKVDQERVFERFFRVDKARSRATGGTGLGLSIVKHVAADHGGTVEVESAPGRGSTFTLVLPTAPAPRKEPA